MLETIKKILGLNSAEFDDLINFYINAGIRDLEAVGVEQIEDDLYKSAVIFYVRANFDTVNFDKYINAYTLAKDFLRKSSEYNVS